MPKIVDHEKRKEQIAEATWRIIVKHGIQGATVRNIAQEAQLSLGALRHYFKTQDDLLLFAMELVKKQATKRIYAIAISDFPPLDKVIRIIFELLPLDSNKTVEMEVWFSFVFYCRHNEYLFNIHQDGIFTETGRLLAYLNDHHLLVPGLDLSMEQERLYSLVDGLAIHAMLERKRMSDHLIKQTIYYHFRSICIPEAFDQLQM